MWTRGEERGCKMAADTNNITLQANIFTKFSRIEMNKLRDSGREYISNVGKVMPAKTQMDVFCVCPQRCPRKLPRTVWRTLFDQFYELGDQAKQNAYLQNHISIKTVHLHNWEIRDRATTNKRRVTCKYHIPKIEPNDHLKNYLEKQAEHTIEVCQKAFMNVFGITEKRLRVQRERCIANLNPDYLRKKSQITNDIKENGTSDDSDPMSADLGDCSPDPPSPGPLDLSNHSDRSASPIEIDKSKLYEMADMLGLPRSTVDDEMIIKYEELVRKNLAKQQKEMSRGKKNGAKDTTVANLRGISEQVVGLQENLTILPIQTLNNGDLTITPILASGTRPVENDDIMQVNSFFQNQLWRPEYIGLSSNKLDALK